MPIGSRLDQLAGWLIAEGGLERVDPLTRPYRLAALRRAAAAQDTALLSAAGRRAFGWLEAELAAVADSTAVVCELGEALYRNGRRDSFRQGGTPGAGAMGGVWVSLTRGPWVVVFNPAFENRLRDDPEYTGKKDRFIAGRLQTGYVALTGERGDLFFGRASRNWGANLFQGLQLSPSAYSTDMLSGTLRIGRFELTTIAQRLDDYDTTSAVPIGRYFLAHRLSVRAWRGAWIALTETGVYAGPGRGFEPAFHAPLNPGLLSEFNEQRDVNLMWGAELHARLGHGLTLDGQGVIDDIQIDRGALEDRRPWSGGFTLVVSAALPRSPMHASVGYTQVRSLTYRNSSAGYDVYAAGGVGIARNFSDYDQVLVRLERRLSARTHVALDGSYLRQGSGDLRLPFPPDTVLAGGGQGFLVAPVRHGAGVRLSAAAEPLNGILVSGELGLNGKLGGGAETIAALALHVRFDAVRRSFGGALPALEAGTTTGWP